MSKKFLLQHVFSLANTKLNIPFGFVTGTVLEVYICCKFQKLNFIAQYSYSRVSDQSPDGSITKHNFLVTY